MNLSSFILAIICVNVAVAAIRKPKIKAAPTEKPINWNLSYYAEPFNLCKPLRILSTLEQARAHGFAVDVFRKCGPTLVIPYAQRYNFPAYAIPKATEIFCFLCNLACEGGYFDLTTAAGVDGALRFIDRYCEAWKVSNFSVKVKHKNETFLMTHDMCHGFLLDVISCALKKVGFQRAEYAKYAVQHFKKILL